LRAGAQRFPEAGLPVEQFLYWAKGGVGTEPSITLHHLVIQREPGGSIYIANKQLYASRYMDAGLLVLSLGSHCSTNAGRSISRGSKPSGPSYARSLPSF
jgi:hypothetical protein